MGSTNNLLSALLQLSISTVKATVHTYRAQYVDKKRMGQTLAFLDQSKVEYTLYITDHKLSQIRY